MESTKPIEPLPCHLCGEAMVQEGQQWLHGSEQEGCFLFHQYLDDEDDVVHWNEVREPLARRVAGEVASLKQRIADGIASFAADPPDSDHQRGYLAALEELAK